MTHQTPEPTSEGAAIKARLRQRFRCSRDRLDTQTLSQQLCDRLAAWSSLQRARTILAYWPHHSELSLLNLMEHWPDKTWGLPRCLPASQLAWHVYAPVVDRDGLVPGSFGILEPPASQPEIELETVDAMLLPALACDSWGTRLGYGGGYYDRCLGQPALRACLTVGIVTSAGFSREPLPYEPWDIPVHAIATPHQIVSARAR